MSKELDQIDYTTYSLTWLDNEGFGFRTVTFNNIEVAQEMCTRLQLEECEFIHLCRTTNTTLFKRDRSVHYINFDDV